MRYIGRIFLFSAAVLAVGLCSCGKSASAETERRASGFLGAGLGRKAGARAEKRETPVRWQGVSGMAEIRATPLSFTVWQVDFVAPELSAARAEELVSRQWGVRLKNGRAESDGCRIEVLPAFDRGPGARRIRVTELAAEKLLSEEEASPEVARRRKSEQAHETILLLEEAMEHFRTDTGRYPADLCELPENAFVRRNWRGPYFDRIPRDPWGAEYRYRASEDGMSYELFCGGENGAEKLR